MFPTTTKTQKSVGLGDIRKIKKLASKKGTPLLDVSFGKTKKFIRFQYKTTSGGVFAVSYPSVIQGIRKELSRLGR